jgi:hypothetical protein
MGTAPVSEAHWPMARRASLSLDVQETPLDVQEPRLDFDWPSFVFGLIF